MSKAKIAGEPFPLPEPKPAEIASAWIVLLSPYRGVAAGVLALVTASEAEALIAEGAARPASETDLSIGASLARDLTKE